MANQEGHLIAIAIREKSRAPMTELESAEISNERGVNGDFRGKPGKRQVTVLSIEDWRAACEELGQELAWTTRRANLLVDGIRFDQSQGALFHVGDAVLEVMSETEPCGRMDEAAPGLCRALTPEWRGGVCCRVISGGSVFVGDAVALEEVDQGGK